MPALKPKDQQRVILNVTCSTTEKKLVDKEFKNSGFPDRSKFILHKIFEAIAYGDEYITEKPPKHATKATIQLSCTPQQRKTIKEYCANQLPNFKRSRWIVGLLINYCQKSS